MDSTLFEHLLNSLKSPVMFCDTEHIIRYMNRAAVEHYTGGKGLLGSSVLACHNERSCEEIREIFARMQGGS